MSQNKANLKYISPYIIDNIDPTSSVQTQLLYVTKRPYDLFHYEEITSFIPVVPGAKFLFTIDFKNYYTYSLVDKEWKIAFVRDAKEKP